MPTPLPPTLEKVAPPLRVCAQGICDFHVPLTTICFPHKILSTFFLNFLSQVRRWLVPGGTENNTNAQYCGENKTAE